MQGKFRWLATKKSFHVLPPFPRIGLAKTRRSCWSPNLGAGETLCWAICHSTEMAGEELSARFVMSSS